MPNQVVIETQDQFGKWIRIGTASGYPASVKQALETALKTNPMAKRSGRVRAMDKITGQLVDLRT